METVTTTLAVPNQEGSGPASPTLSQAGHHRKNHRGGARERARRERKASDALTPSTPSSAMSSSSSVSGARKNSHRAGIKYKAKKERQALSKMTSDGIEPVDVLYDSEDQYQEGEEDHEDDRHSEHDAPSLTYDSDEHEEENEVHEVPDDIFKPNEVQESIDSKVDLHTEQDTVAYQEKVDAGVEVIMKGSEKVVQEEILVAPSQVAVEKSKAPVPSVTLTPPKKQPIKLLSLMRPKVL